MFFWVRYFIGTPLLVIIHIQKTQKWAVPFPCSKTKSKISFSLGWAQEGLIIVPCVTTYAVPLRMRTQTQTITKKEPVIMTCTHKPGQNNRVYYTACNLYSTGDRPCNFVFILLLLYQSIYSLIALSNSSIVLYSSQ